MWLILSPLCAAKNGKLELVNGGEVETFALECKTILEFATGSSRPPAIGFLSPPTISFQNNSPFPRSNTCTNTLYLSVARPLPTSDQFIYRMTYGILNAAGFGRV